MTARPSLAIGRSVGGLGIATPASRLRLANSDWGTTTRVSLRLQSRAPWRASASDEVDEAANEAQRRLDDSKQRAASSLDDLKAKSSDSKQSFSNTVEDFKIVAGKAQSHAQETANKELEKLKDITNQLLEQAEQARKKLTATAQETAYKQKDNLAFVVENGPEPVKEVAETALNAHYSETGKQGSKIHDFCLGIPYGASLTLGGLLWFIIYGTTSAIRFGVLLGSAILFLSITSLKKWKQGESSISYIQGQAAITAFIFLRYYRRYTVTKAFFPTALTGLISGAMLGFYIYVLVSGGNPPKKPKNTQSKQ